jgi:hypothetical protein
MGRSIVPACWPVNRMPSNGATWGIASCADSFAAATVRPLWFNSRSMSGFGVIVPGCSTFA